MGSLTQTVTPTGGGTEGTVDEQLRQPVGILTLRGAAAPEAERRGGIRWAGDVIDNEGMGKKKSKVCCIYHKPCAVDESSNESSDSSSSESDSEDDISTARGSGGARRREGDQQHTHKRGYICKAPHGDSSAGGCTAKGKSRGTRTKSPNAYEKMPRRDTRR